MMPKSLTDVGELARLIASAEWAPDCYRDLAGNYMPQRIELAIMHGATVGLGPIAAVQSIAVIDGTPTIWGDGALALVERSGLLEDMQEEYQSDSAEGLIAICTIRRRGRPTPIVNRFSTAMAEQARLTQKEGPWQLYPQRMLRMRARSWSIRDGFADVLRGLHIREEVQDRVDLRQPRPALNTRPPLGPQRVMAPRPRPISPAAGRTPHSGETPTSPGQEDHELVGDAAISVESGHTEPDREAAEAAAARVLAPADTEPDLAISATATDESFTLIDADGVVIELADPDRLRIEFDRIFSDLGLPPDQITRLWQLNASARGAIERRFGKQALQKAEDRLRLTDDAKGRFSRAQKVTEGVAVGRASPTLTPQDIGDVTSASNPPAITVDRRWGDRKLLRHYRARLAAVQGDGPAGNPEIARFRAANRAIEDRLRLGLPQLMQEIDRVYGSQGATVQQDGSALLT